MLSADNFFWRIDLRGGVMTRVAKWRELDRPEAALLGVQYIGNDMGEHRGAWLLRKASASSVALLRHGLRRRAGPSPTPGSRSTTRTSSSPKGTQVIGELPNLLGPGMTGQMTYYSTARGAQVFSAGAFSLAGSIRQKAVARLVENIWAGFTSGSRHNPPSMNPRQGRRMIRFRTDIEGLRGVAVLLVFLDHLRVPGFPGATSASMSSSSSPAT